MGKVVLYADGRKPMLSRMRQGKAGGEIIRVQVMADGRGLDPKEALEELDRVLKGAHGLVVLQIADMVAQEGIVLPG